MASSYGWGDAGASFSGVGTPAVAREGTRVDAVSGARADHKRHSQAAGGCCACVGAGDLLSTSQPRRLPFPSQTQARPVSCFRLCVVILKALDQSSAFNQMFVWWAGWGSNRRSDTPYTLLLPRRIATYRGT